MVVDDQHHAPATLTPEKDPLLIVKEAGWAPGPVWMVAENIVRTGIRFPDRPARSESLYRLEISRSNFLLISKLHTGVSFCSCLSKFDHKHDLCPDREGHVGLF